jgi:DNA-binding CsgD family transcriptional regulator
MANIFNNLFFEIPSLISLFLVVIIFAAEYAITYYLYLFILGLRNEKISRKASYLFIAWIAFFTSASMLGMFMYYSHADESWFYVIHQSWIFSMDFIILYTLINHLITHKQTPEPKVRKLLHSFGYIFLTGYAGFTLSHINFYFFHTNIEKYDPLILLLINLCPLLWIQGFYLKYQLSYTSGTNSISSTNKFAKEFNLTSREKEIVELIMKGKTNKEIEINLFISFNTVKNHIYNIFKKTGVKSRSELLYFIRNNENNRL